MPNDIKAIIWDLDDTFWTGSLTEGGHTYQIRRHDIVVELARRGIVSAICSINDREEARSVLEHNGIWDYFVFPSINKNPKGPRIKTMIEDLQLLPRNVLFIDDTAANRNEAVHFVPDLQVADETIIDALLTDERLSGKDDGDLTRLAHYKLMQHRHVERRSASDNIDFLRSADIVARIDPDVESHLDRAIELINRTNQLNFTKRRLPEDMSEARNALRELLREYDVHAGLLAVSDKYGDHGLVGLYVMKGFAYGRTLLHFCFSCRVMNMGLETWLYDQIGKPKLRIVGQTSSTFSPSRDEPVVDWINGVPGPDRRDLARSSPWVAKQVMAHGGCNISAISHYFQIAGAKVFERTNVARNKIDTRIDHSIFFRMAMDGTGPVEEREFLSLGFERSDWSNDLLIAKSEDPVWLLSFWADADTILYRHKDLNIEVPFSMHFDGVPDDLTQLSPSDVPDHLASPWLVTALEHLKKHYVRSGLISEKNFKTNLTMMLKRAPPRAKIFILTNNETLVDAEGKKVHMWWKKQANDWLRSAVAPFINVELIDLFSLCGGHEVALDPNHVDRLGYYRVYQLITDRLTPRR